MSNLIDVTMDNVNEITTGKSMAVFTTPYCGPCRVFKANLNTSGAEFTEATGYDIYIIDASMMRELASKYDVTTVPTTIFMEDGNEIHRENGIVDMVTVKDNV